MGMRTWKRKVAHAKVERLGIKHANKDRINPMNGRKAPSWFAVNWRKMASTPLPKPKNRRKRKISIPEPKRKIGGSL